MDGVRELDTTESARTFRFANLSSRAAAAAGAARRVRAEHERKAAPDAPTSSFFRTVSSGNLARSAHGSSRLWGPCTRGTKQVSGGSPASA